VDATAVNSIFTINPTTVLSLRYGFNRFPNFDYNSSLGFNIASLGFNKAYESSISPAVAEFPGPRGLRTLVRRVCCGSVERSSTDRTVS
jgi:hypothetical protein